VANTLLLHRLKNDTRSEHEGLERAVDLAWYLGEVERYRMLLRLFYGFHRGWEAQLMAQAPEDVQLFYLDRRKTPLLEDDLRLLGDSDEDLRRVRLCRFGNLASRARALGSMYVVEGSTLGGQVIARIVEAELGYRQGAGYSFFRGYGTETATMWRGLQDFLTRAAQGTPDEEVVAEARQMFATLQAWFAHARASTHAA
jgi:heme oxygenase